MNLENLKNTCSVLQKGMKTNGYSKDTCSKINNALKFLLGNMDNNWANYGEAFEAFKNERKHLSTKTIQNYSLAFFHIENFDLNGIIPDHDLTIRDSKRTAKYLYLNKEFRDFIDFSWQQGLNKGLAEKTLKARRSTGGVFFKEMMDLGRDSLAEISEEDILSYCLDEELTPKKDPGMINTLRQLFQDGLEFNKSECERILNLLPTPRCRKKNQPVFNEGEVGKIKAVLEDENSPLDYRDKALANLLLYTGARASEAAHLEFPDINLEDNEISYVQGKNKARVYKPMNQKVKKALLDYVEHQRPESDSQKVFQSKKTKPSNIEYSAVRYDITQVFKAAGIRTHGEKGSTHMFRRNLATALLNADTDRAEISKLLGHTDPNSIESYLAADFEGLKKCALSVEMFPVDEAVFDV